MKGSLASTTSTGSRCYHWVFWKLHTVPCYKRKAETRCETVVPNRATSSDALWRTGGGALWVLGYNDSFGRQTSLSWMQRESCGDLSWKPHVVCSSSAVWHGSLAWSERMGLLYVGQRKGFESASVCHISPVGVVETLDVHPNATRVCGYAEVIGDTLYSWGPELSPRHSAAVAKFARVKV